MARRDRSGGSGEKVGQQAVAVLGEDRFRVELYAFHIKVTVPQAHDQSVVGCGDHFQLIGQRRLLDDQGVVTSGL